MGVIAAFMVPHPPMVIPEIGRGGEKEIQKTIDAYEEVARRIACIRPETIVLISPHQAMYADYFHISPGSGAKGDFGQFHEEKVKMEVCYDTGFVKELCALAEKKELPAGGLGKTKRQLDHGTMVPLYFVNRHWKEYRLVGIGLSGLSFVRHYEMGQCIRDAAQILGRRTVLIASGDLSHRLKEDGPYGFRKEGPEYDREIMDVMGRGAFGELFDFSEHFCEEAGECGHRAFLVMAGALDRTAVQPECLSYEGPFGVGYGVCAYEVTGNDPGRNFKEQYEERHRQQATAKRYREDAYVRLARRSIEEYVKTGKKLSVPRGLPKEMYERRAGVFVSLKKGGRLRGCMGTVRAACASVAEEIIDNAVSAAARDPRFSPVEPEEVELLSISVDVVGRPEKISSPEELNVKRYGVIVTRGRRQGLLLPDLDGVDTVEEQIGIAKQKAGIGSTMKAELERFETERHC